MRDLELDIDGATCDVAVRLLTSRLIRNVRSISYLPIAPPAWLQINGDELKGQPFHGGVDLPEIFSLGNAIRCSCGSTAL